MKKLKVAIVGVGGIFEAHMAAYRGNENVEVVALCDINEKLLREKGEKYGIGKLFTDEKEMFDACPEIEAVSVCTWNSAHAENTITALNAGKHVLCEKPMARSAEEAAKMIEAAKRNKRKLTVGFVRRFGNDTRVVQDFIAGGNVGDIYFAKASYLRRCGNPGGWFCDKKRSGGGPLIDLGVHVIDLARYLMGNPKPVSVSCVTFDKLGNRSNFIKGTSAYASAERSARDKSDVEDLAVALIRFDNGAAISVEASFDLNIKQDTGSIELFGTKGGVKIDPEFELYTVMNDYLADVHLKAPTALSFNGLFQNEIDSFVNAVLQDEDLSSVAEDGLTLMKILDAAYLSAQTGQEVRI